VALTATELAASAGAPVVPVIVIDDAEHAVALGEALVAGGIRTAEVTLRTPAGLEAIRRMAQVGGLIVGAGTVIDPEGVDRAVDAGARFIVSPGLDEAVVNRCRDLDVLALPGVATASEVQHAMRLGLQAVKLFPAGVMGGATLISALGGPFPDMQFMPSGGVSLASAPEYLALASVSLISGSWMVSRELIASQQFGEIERISRQTTEALTA